MQLQHSGLQERILHGESCSQADGPHIGAGALPMSLLAPRIAHLLGTATPMVLPFYTPTVSHVLR
jgi:hypothetical protein